MSTGRWLAGLWLPALLASAWGAAPPVQGPPRLDPGQQRQIDLLQAHLFTAGAAGRFDESEKAARRIAALREQWQGKRHWQTSDARLEVERWQRLAKVPAGDRAVVVRALELHGQGTRLDARGRSREAEKKLRQALALCRKALGEEHAETAFACNSLAHCLQRQAGYAQALPLLEQARAICRKALGEEHPFTAAGHGNVASCLSDLGRHAEALPLYRRALAIRRKALGEEHPDTAAGISNLAYCLHALGKFPEALALHRQALALRRRVLGEEHLDTAVSYNNLAICLRGEGKYAQALPLFEKALAIVRQARGEAHPDTARAYHNLAHCLQGQSKYALAVPLYQRALRIRQKALGEEHPATALGYGNLASCLQAQGKPAEALPLFEKALAIQRKALGEQHPDLALNWANLASCLADLGRYAQARPLYAKALASNRRALGAEHPHTATSLNNLAGCLQALGRRGEALALHRQALAIRRKVLGEEHLDTAVSYDNLAGCLQAPGKHADALPLFEKALAIRKKVLGEEHPHTAGSYNNVAYCLNALGRHAEALPLYRKALQARQKVLGEDHAGTALVYLNLAACLQAQHRSALALPLFHRALAIFRKVLGEDHPSTAVAYGNLADCLGAQGRSAEALPLFQKSLAIKLRMLGEAHPESIRGHNNLAICLHNQGRDSEAVALLRKALEITRKVQGEEHLDTAHACNNLAACLHALGQHAEELPLLRTARAIFHTVHGEKHPATATSCNNLGTCLQAQGKPDQALPLFREALAICRTVLGEEHPSTANSYNNVASCLHLQGKHADALPLFRRALEISRKVLGEDHPATAARYHNLAYCLHALGQPGQAMRYWQAALRGYESGRLDSHAAGFDRSVYLSAHRIAPRAALAALLARHAQPRQAWRFAEANLARGLLDDRGPAPSSASRASRLALLAQLDARVVHLLGLPRPSPEQRRQLRAVERQRRGLLAEMAREKADVSARRLLPLERIQKQIAADTALVFWLDLPTLGQHFGCVVRGQGLPAWVPLPGSGPAGKWTKEDLSLPLQLHQALLEIAPPERIGKLAGALARQRLLPLKPHLEGVRRLVVIPTGYMSTAPVEVLGGAYLISYAPSGSVFAQAGEQHRPLAGSSLLALGDPVFEVPRARLPEPPGHGVMLNVVLPGSNAARARRRAGDVLLSIGKHRLESAGELEAALAALPAAATYWRDGRQGQVQLAGAPLGAVFDQRSARAAVRAWRRQAGPVLRGSGHKRLPGTRLEVEAIARLVPRRSILLGSLASEEQLDRMVAAGYLKHFRLIHLDTHGEVDWLRPERSALILAQDRLPSAAEALRSNRKFHDGRLKVQTILRDWQLDCDLVVLSACQTALGKEAGGEGLLGFAQAFLTCGARSVVLSRWKVDDTATALFMVRFYENLLGKRAGLKKAMPRAEALAEAKQWLRLLPRKQAGELAARYAGGVLRGTEDDARPVVKGKEGKLPEGERPFAHPYFWAAFVLVGDPS